MRSDATHKGIRRARAEGNASKTERTERCIVLSGQSELAGCVPPGNSK